MADSESDSVASRVKLRRRTINFMADGCSSPGASLVKRRRRRKNSTADCCSSPGASRARLTRRTENSTADRCSSPGAPVSEEAGYESDEFSENFRIGEGRVIDFDRDSYDEPEGYNRRISYVELGDGRIVEFSCDDDGKRRPDDKVYSKYWKRIVDSGGFDIVDFPGNSMYTPYVPSDLTDEKEDITKCAIQALKCYNKQFKTHFVFSKILWATWRSAGGFMRFITFEAAEGGRTDDPAAVKKFQAKVFQMFQPFPKLKIRVMFCRLRKEQEVDFEPFVHQPPK